jgi:hypothetical protein
MLAEIQDLRQNPVSEDTIAQMAGFFLTSYYLKQETNAAQAGQLAQYELIGGGGETRWSFSTASARSNQRTSRPSPRSTMKNVRFVAPSANRPNIDKSVFLAQNLKKQAADVASLLPLFVYSDLTLSVLPCTRSLSDLLGEGGGCSLLADRIRRRFAQADPAESAGYSSAT